MRPQPPSSPSRGGRAAVAAALLAMVTVLLSAAGAAAPAYSEREALTAVAYASAVSCADEALLRRWDCSMCRHGVPPVPAPPSLTQVQVVRSRDGINQGLIGLDAPGQRLVVAFRGSVDLSQWIFDLDVRLISRYASQGCKHCLVHDGFVAAFEEIGSEVLAAVASLSNSSGVRRVLVTGHSLGAAMAVHCALRLANTEPDFEIVGYTFGQPRVGNRPFAEFAQAKLPHWFRVVNYLDPVAQCVKLPGYYHHMATEVWYFDKPQPGHSPGRYRVCSSANGEDDACQNSRCGGFKLCVDGSFHVSYMNLRDLTDVSAVCGQDHLGQMLALS